MTDTTGSAPFGHAAHIYRAAGWQGTLPIGNGPGKKYPPPNGWTGHDAPMPSASDVAAWQETHADRNIGLRLPPGVIGLDVDQYGKDAKQKTGGDTLAELVAKHGPLPPTWITSARTDGVSGIRLFRVPLELDGTPINWPGEAGPNIEIIQTGHRYALVWPSTNPEADGAEYAWQVPPGWTKPVGAVPTVDSLPELPETWVRGLALGYARTEKADLATPALARWWEALRQGAPCPIVGRTLQAALSELRNNVGARHETTRDTLRALVTFGAEGHEGAPQSVFVLQQAFAEAVGPERVASGEWQRLLSGAVKLAAAKHNPPLQRCACTPPTLPRLESVMPNPTAPEAGRPPAVGPAAPAPGYLTLPDEFWQARESLQRIRQAAHSRVRSGDAVFYGVLCRLSASAPHTLSLDTGVGTRGSLNLFAAIVGPSGGGKSSGLGVARDLIKVDAELEENALGSGEGVAESFMGTVMAGTGQMKADGSEKQERVRKQVRHNVLLHADEGASLNKMLERTGSIVGETLRSAWSGEKIGQKNGREETTRSVPGGTYALGLLIGYQPTTVMPLLADVDAGTPQRFLYGWAVDPSIPSREHRVAWPGELANPFPPGTPTNLPPPGTLFVAPVPQAVGLPQLITYDEAIRDELYDRQHAKASGTLPADHPHRDPYRSQHDLLKAKVSALLALLEQRRHVTVDDWRLAQVILDTSDAVRQHLQQQAVYAAREAWERETESASRRALHTHLTITQAAETAADARLRQAAVTLTARVRAAGTDGLTRSVARRGMKADYRKAYDDVAAYATEWGWLVADDAGRLLPGASMPADPL